MIKKNKKGTQVRDLKTKKDVKGGGKKKHKVTVHDISITKTIDKSSPLLIG